MGLGMEIKIVLQSDWSPNYHNINLYNNVINLEKICLNSGIYSIELFDIRTAETENSQLHRIIFLVTLLSSV